jgi:hypothetical protein
MEQDDDDDDELHHQTIDHHHHHVILHGLQCLSALALVFFHVHLLEGSHFFLSTDSCMLDKHNNSLLFNLSFQMTAFWFASGYFCEWQLSQQRRRRRLLVLLRVEEDDATNKKDEDSGATKNANVNMACAGKEMQVKDHDVRLGFGDNARVFVHHWLRRFPLVAIMMVLLFLRKQRHGSSNGNGNLPDELECSVPRLIQGMLLLVPVHEAEKCMGPGLGPISHPCVCAGTRTSRYKPHIPKRCSL